MKKQRNRNTDCCIIEKPDSSWDMCLIVIENGKETVKYHDEECVVSKHQYQTAERVINFVFLFKLIERQSGEHAPEMYQRIHEHNTKLSL